MVPEEITPLVPALAGEKVADDQTCHVLQTLLKFMVTQVRPHSNNKPQKHKLGMSSHLHVVPQGISYRQM